MQYKDFSRALRRHHVARLKHTRKHYWGRGPEALTGQNLGMVVATPANCSCCSCGNSRKWFGERTVQEQKQYQCSVAQLLLDEAGDTVVE